MNLSIRKIFPIPSFPVCRLGRRPPSRNLMKTNGKLYKNEIPKPVRDDPLITSYLFQINFSEVSKKLIENCSRMSVQILKKVTKPGNGKFP